MTDKTDIRGGQKSPIVRFGAALLFFGVLIAAVLGSMTPRSTTGSSDRPVQPVPASSVAAPLQPATSSAQVIRTSAIELFNAYEANEVAADDHLRGRPVEVSGTVQSIDKDFTDSVVIHLATANEFLPAGFTMRDSERSKAAALQRGQKIVVLCPTVKRIVGSPQGSDCTITTD